MTDPSALAAAIEPRTVLSQMTSHRPGLMDPNSDDHDLFLTTLRGVCTEVQPYVGSTGSGPRWDLAVWAVTLGVAARIEDTIYHEQQDDNGLAAKTTEERYRAVLKQLSGRLPGDAGSDGDSGRPPGPVGNFPAPRLYPDPLPGGYGTGSGWPFGRIPPQ